MKTTASISPPLQASQWLNSPKPVTLDGLHGRVVVLHTFQMPCPGCVSHGLPQALRIHRLFPHESVAVIGQLLIEAPSCTAIDSTATAADRIRASACADGACGLDASS